jgi:hypothetical protein
MIDRRVASALLACAGVALSRPARGQPQACVASYETAQEDRLGNDLLASRNQLLQCVALCPSPFREQCKVWQAEIDSYLSSIVVRVVDASGARVPMQAAYADARRFDPGEELLLVPGEHLIRVEVGARSLERRVTTKARERGVVVELVLQPPPANAEPASTPPASYVPAFVALGVSAASLVTSASLTIYGHVRRSELESSCAPRCDPATATPIQTAWGLAAGFAALGAAGLVAGWILWPSAPRAAASFGGRGLELRF